MVERGKPVDNYVHIVGANEYSLDGGKTWQTTDSGYDSLDPANGGTSAPPAMVLLRDTQAGGLIVEFDYNGQNYVFGLGAYLGSGQ